MNRLCDRIEIRLWAEENRLSIDSIQQELTDGLDSDEAAYEDALASIEVLEARKLIMGDQYPFEIDDGVAIYSPINGNGVPYVFCTALATMSPSHITSKARSETFELVAMDAAAGYFNAPLRFPTGATSHKLHFADYEEMLHKLEKVVVELRSAKRFDPPGGGDAGWDFLLVKPFCDNDYSRLVIGGNCATGTTNWLKKGSETVFDHWFRYYFDGRRPNGPYLEVLAVPFIADDDDRSRKTGPNTFVMDRFRIAEHCRYTGRDMSDWLENIKSSAGDLELR